MTTTEPRSNKTRSPNYPSIDLKDAMERLKVIYGTQRQYPATREILVKLMGYSSLNGASATIVSALSKYGLIEGHSDNLRVSDLGQDLVLHRQGDPEYTQAIKEAAFTPAFFQELSNQFPDDLPSEHSLRATLIKRGFNPKAIDGAVRAYRDTMEFLNSIIGDSEPEQTRGSGSDPTVPQQSTITPDNQVSISSTTAQKSIQLPLSTTEWATLQAPFPLTETAWEQMITVLMAMKPALIVSPEPPSQARFTPTTQERDFEPQKLSGE